MDRNTTEKIILIIPYICFPMLVLSLSLLKSNVLLNIGLWGSIAGIPIGIAGKKMTAFKRLSTGDILIGSITLTALLGFIGFLCYIGRIIGGA